jgi:hypothetical protein
MPNKINYKGSFQSAIDLGNLIAAGGELPKEIPVLPKGEFMTMPYGNMVLDDRVFDEMIANYNQNVRRRVPVDVDHCMNGETKAGGWVTGLINKEDGLWAAVKWNKLGKELVGEEIYKMMSAEWSFDYIDPQKSTHHGAVLVAVTLTNRPLMQSMPTITASTENLTNPNSIMLLFNQDIKKEKIMPTLIDILKKSVSERTEEELKFIADNEADLTDEQKTQLETEKTEADDAAKKLEEEKQAEKEVAEGEAKEAAEKEDTEACKAALIKAGNTEEEAIIASEKMVADCKAAKENITISASELKRLQEIEVNQKAMELKKASEDFSAPFMASDKGGKIAPAGKDSMLELVASLNDKQKELLKNVLASTADQKIADVKGEDNNAGLTATEQYLNFIKEYKAENKNASTSEISKAFEKKYPEVAKQYKVENN